MLEKIIFALTVDKLVATVDVSADTLLLIPIIVVSTGKYAAVLALV